MRGDFCCVVIMSSPGWGAARGKSGAPGVQPTLPQAHHRGAWFQGCWDSASRAEPGALPAAEVCTCIDLQHGWLTRRSSHRVPARQTGGAGVCFAELGAGVQWHGPRDWLPPAPVSVSTAPGGPPFTRLHGLHRWNAGRWLVVRVCRLMATCTAPQRAFVWHVAGIAGGLAVYAPQPGQHQVNTICLSSHARRSAHCNSERLVGPQSPACPRSAHAAALTRECPVGPTWATLVTGRMH